ncbi:GNAT family N-acetyltransferase [Nesterenkonia halotolerans]|uniref:GNAT family N-acetyltransferase n=1 Tax=Nesterenkonia halotolerans TaxID=225325 RepID=UPI003EE7F212
MDIALRPLLIEDAASIVAAEDDETVRWFSGGRSTVEGTRAYIGRLCEDAAAGSPKRAFGIWGDGECVGTIDYDPDVTDALDPGDVNISYGVAPWARGQGVASRAVVLLCEFLEGRDVGRRAAIRADTRNPASARVAQKAGFEELREARSTEEAGEDGVPVVFRVFVRPFAGQRQSCAS